MSSTKYAGFWLRFVAYIIDNIIIQIIQSFVIIPVLGVMGIGFASASAFDWDDISGAETVGMLIAFISAMSALVIVSLIIQVLYYALMESSKNKATLGKMALGLEVVDMDGKKLDFGKALIRQLGKIISGMIFLIGYIMAGFTEKKQALHDIIAGTLVVKK